MSDEDKLKTCSDYLKLDENTTLEIKCAKYFNDELRFNWFINGKLKVLGLNEYDIDDLFSICCYFTDMLNEYYFRNNLFKSVTNLEIPHLRHRFKFTIVKETDSFTLEYIHTHEDKSEILVAGSLDALGKLCSLLADTSLSAYGLYDD